MVWIFEQNTISCIALKLWRVAAIKGLPAQACHVSFLSALTGKYYGRHWEPVSLQQVARILTLCKFDQRSSLWTCSCILWPKLPGVTGCCATPFSPRLGEFFVIEQKLTRTFGTAVIFILAFCLLLHALIMMFARNCVLSAVFVTLTLKPDPPTPPLHSYHHVTSCIKHSIIVRWC